MKRILLFIMVITFSLAPFAQKHSAQKKPVRKTAVTAKKKAATPARKKNSRRHVSRKTSKSAASTRAERKAATYSNASIRGLQGQRASIRKKIREQEQALQRNKACACNNYQWWIYTVFYFACSFSDWYVRIIQGNEGAE